MKTFMVKYIKDNELKIAYVQGINQLEAQEKFLKYFSLEKDNIIEVTNLKGVKNNYKTATAITKFMAILGVLSIVGGILAMLTMFGITNRRRHGNFWFIYDYGFTTYNGKYRQC